MNKSLLGRKKEREKERKEDREGRREGEREGEKLNKFQAEGKM